MARRVRMKAVLGRDCEIVRGRLKASGRQVPFAAPRCGDDGVLSGEVGEQCASPDACGPERACVDCRCVSAVNFARDVEPVFQSCLTLACHESEATPGGFGLTPGLALPALLGRVARSGPCTGRPLVLPGDPDASVLVERVSGNACGSRMPVGPVPLPPAAVDAIRAWVAQGARAD